MLTYTASSPGRRMKRGSEAGTSTISITVAASDVRVSENSTFVDYLFYANDPEGVALTWSLRAVGDHARAVYEVAREERPRMSRLVPAWPEAHARPESFTQLSGEKFDCPPADLEYLKVFLLITVVVVLAMIVMATGRLLHGLEKSLKIVVKALAAARAAPGH